MVTTLHTPPTPWLESAIRLQPSGLTLIAVSEHTAASWAHVAQPDLGHLAHLELANLIGHSAAMLVTPAWDEPYGLVVAESLACGTPVCVCTRRDPRDSRR